MAEAIAERDMALLLDMLLAARDAPRSFVKGLDEAAFMASSLHQSAVIRSLEVIGEAAGRVSPDARARLPQIPWREIIGMRHRLIHGYDEVRLDLVWAVTQEQLGPLIATLACDPRRGRSRPLNSTTHEALAPPAMASVARVVTIRRAMRTITRRRPSSVTSG